MRARAAAAPFRQALLCGRRGLGIPPALAAPRLQRAQSPAKFGAKAWPHGVLVPGARTYLDSVDRTVTVRSMENPLEVFEFMAANTDCDIRTQEAALRSVAKKTDIRNYQAVVSDPRFHAMLSALARRLDDCEVRMLAMIADCVARFRVSTPELSDFAQRLAEVVVRREDAFNPRNLATVALALSARGVRDAAAVEFVRTEAMKLMNDMEPPQCTTLLEAFRRWGVFDRQLVDLIVERMCDEVDRFSSRDVVDAMGVASRLGLARGFLLRRLCTLAFENLNQFTTSEMVRMAHSLSKLRFLSRSATDDLIDAIRPQVGRLPPAQAAELVYALAMTDARHQLDVARGLFSSYFDAPPQGKSLNSMVNVCWALCSLELVPEFKKEFAATLDQIFERQAPQNRIPLTKLFDVVCCIDLEHKALGVTVPAAWKAACDDADRFEMDRLESSRLHNEIVMRFDNLRGNANGMKWQLRMQRNQPCGPYRVDMLDEDTKVVLDVEIISWPTSRRLKHRLLQDLGYKPLRLDYWEWRRARSEEDQNTFLEREVSRLLDD